MIILCHFQYFLFLGFVLIFPNVLTALSFPIFDSKINWHIQEQQRIMIPNQLFNMSGYDVKLTWITLNVDYGDWVSSYFSESMVSMLSEDLLLTINASWSCKHHTSPLKFPQGNGKISGVFRGATNETSLELITLIGKTHLQKSGDKIPIMTNISLKDCRPNLALRNLDFTGNWKPFGSNLTQLISNFLIQEVPQAVCKKEQNMVDTTVNALVGVIWGFINTSGLLDPFPPSIPPNLPSNLPLVNWQDNQLLKVLDFLLDDAGQIMNIFINCLTNDTGAISIELDSKDLKGWQQLFNVELFPNISDYSPELLLDGTVQLNVSGLDTFYDFRVLKPVTNFSLSTELALRWLNISLDIFAPALEGHMLIDVVLRDARLIVDFTAGVKRGMSDLRLSQLVKQHCFESFIYTVNFTRLEVATHVPVISIGPGLDGILALLTNEYNPTIVALINHLVTGLRPTLNDAIESTLANISSNISNNCFPAVYPSPSHIIDWQKNDLLLLVNKVVNHVRESDGQLAINLLIDQIVSNMNMSAEDIKIPLNMSFTFGNQSVMISQLRIMGLDELGELKVLVPVKPHALNNHLRLGTDRPFNITLTFSIMSPDFSNSERATELEISLIDLKFAAQADVRLDYGILEDLFINETKKITCLASSMNPIKVNSVNVNGFVKITNNASGQNFSFGISPDTNFESLLGLVFTNVVNTGLYRAPYTCQNTTAPPLPTPAPSILDSTMAHYVGLVAVSVSIGLAGFGLAAYISGHKQQKEREVVHEESVRTSVKASLSSKLITVVSERDIDLMDSQLTLGNDDSSLFHHPQINIVVRYGIPMIIAADICLFLKACFIDTGATVYAFGVVNKKDIGHVQLFDFGLINTITDMWEAHVYALSLLVAVFSGMWVYIKLFMMLFVWVLPPSTLPTVMRERILVVLDEFGKWSLIDQCLLVIMMVAFHLNVAVGTVELEIQVAAKTGFYDFLGATMASLAISTIVLSYHRYVLGKYPNELPPGGKREALWKHRFFEGGEIGERRLNILWQFLVVFSLIIATIFIIIGSTVHSFSFNFEGAAGILLGANSTTEYSIISLGLELPNSTSHPDAFGIRFIQFIYFFISLALPLTQLIALIFLWLTPLTLKTQSWVYVFCETLHAWSSLEVMVAAILAGLLEIETFASFIVGDKCDSLSDILEILVGSRKCFAVGASLLPGCWVLAVGAIAYVIGSLIAMEQARQALEERRVKHLLTESLLTSKIRSDSADWIRSKTARTKPSKNESEHSSYLSIE